jgi:hypothetical protein
MKDLDKFTGCVGVADGMLLVLFGFQYKKSGAIKNWWLLVLGGVVMFLFQALVLLGLVRLD